MTGDQPDEQVEPIGRFRRVMSSHPAFSLAAMATRTAVAGDDFDPRKILRLIGLAGAGYTAFRFLKGQKIGFVAAASAVLTVISFLDEK